MDSVPDKFWEIVMIGLFFILFIWFGFTAVVILRQKYIKGWVIMSVLVALYGLVAFYGTFRFTDAIQTINNAP
jgi:hypothetical protein